METINKEKEDRIIDIICSIPLEQWDNKSADKNLQTLFKGTAVRLLKTEWPDGSSYASIYIEGLLFRDEGSKCMDMYIKVRNYVQSQEADILSRKIDKILNALTK